MMKSGIAFGVLIASAYALPYYDIHNVKPLPIYELQQKKRESYHFPETCNWDSEEDIARHFDFLATSPAAKVAAMGPGQQIPFGTPHFHALGDSYSAGPGAGELYNGDGGKIAGDWCYRTKGSYAYQMINNEERQMSLGPMAKWQFLSCTGHKTGETIEHQIPQLMHYEYNSDMKVALSIGGNDLGFSSILISCLIGPNLFGSGNCHDAELKARTLIHNLDGKNTFRDALYDVWRGLARKPDYRNPYPRAYPQVIQTLYPRFFSLESDNCDNTGIGFEGHGIPTGPGLTQKLRKEMNDLVDEANQAITEHASNFQLNEFPWARGRIITVDQNPYFEGHRLCEPFVEHLPGFSDPKVYFLGIFSSNTEGGDDETENNWRSNAPTLDQYDPETCDEDVLDSGARFGCQLVKANATAEENLLDGIRLDLPQGVTKLFHPKGNGFTATMKAILNLQPPHIQGRPIAPRWTPDSPYVERRDPEDYQPPPSTVNGTFNGTLPNPPAASASYPLRISTQGTVGCTNKIEEAMGQLGDVSMVDLGDETNLVLYYDGVDDVLDNDDVSTAVDHYFASLDDVQDTAPDATILAARIVAPRGASSDIKGRFADFNDAITEELTKRFNDGQHVATMYMDKMIAGFGNSTYNATMAGISNSDYMAMTNHWVGGASFAALEMGWIEKA